MGQLGKFELDYVLDKIVTTFNFLSVIMFCGLVVISVLGKHMMKYLGMKLMSAINSHMFQQKHLTNMGEVLTTSESR